MTRNNPVPIVNNAGQEVTFERQGTGNASRGSITLKRDETYFERGINLTYETLVLKNPNGDFTNEVISVDDLADDRYERIEVTREFILVKHRRGTWFQMILNFIQRLRPRGDTLPTTV